MAKAWKLTEPQPPAAEKECDLDGRGAFHYSDPQGTLYIVPGQSWAPKSKANGEMEYFFSA